MACGDPRHIYSEKLAATILDRMAAGESLTRICRDSDMPCRKTVLKWQDGKGGATDDFGARYTRAVESRADLIFDDLLELADGTAEQPTYEAIGAAKLQVDTRKWVLARMNQRRYGDRASLALEGGSKNSPPIRVESTASIDDLIETLRIIEEVRADASE